MKTIIYFLLFCATSSTWACDVCGGAVSGSGGTSVPGIFDNYIGLNTSFRSFSSTHLTLFENEEALQSQELFSVVNLHGRYSPIRRLQFLFRLPFSSVRKDMDERVDNTSGLSDVSLRANYMLIDRKNDSTKTYFNAFLGASIKGPTGRNHFQENEAYFFHRNMLPGTGTVDGGVHLELFYRRKNSGWMLNSSGLFRGRIKNVHNFGNIFQNRLSAFQMFEMKQSSLMVDLGIDLIMSSSDSNLKSNATDEYTGGWMISPALRLNYYWNTLILTVQAQRPIAQDLAQGQVINNYALQAGAILLLKK